MVPMRYFPPDEERVAEIKKLLCCGTFYYSWNTQTQAPGTATSDSFSPIHKGGSIDLTLAAQKVARKSAETDNRFFWYGMFIY